MSRMNASFNKSMSKQKSLDTSWFSNIGNEQKTIHYLCVRFTVCLIIGFGWNSARSLRYIKIWYICMRCHFDLPCFDLATMMFLLNHTDMETYTVIQIVRFQTMHSKKLNSRSQWNTTNMKIIYYKIYFSRFIYLHHPWWEWSRYMCYTFNWIG